MPDANAVQQIDEHLRGVLALLDEAELPPYHRTQLEGLAARGREVIAMLRRVPKEPSHG